MNTHPFPRILPLWMIAMAIPCAMRAQPLLMADAGPDVVVCAGESVMLGGNPAAMGGIPPYAYIWSPSNGLSTPTFPNPICAPVATTTYTLLVSDATGAVATDQVTVSLLPSTNAELGVVEPAFQAQFNGSPTFTQCAQDNSALFNFFNSGTVVVGSSFTVDWGDGSPLFTSVQPDWSTAHVYTAGIHTLTYTVTPPDGCPANTIYQIFLGTPPGGGFATDPNTSLCAGDVLPLYITNTAANSSGTVYIVDPGDGGPSEQFSHPPPPQIDHTYQVSSCPGGSFTANFLAVNPCGQSAGQISPIRVSALPAAAFTSAPDDTVCVDVPVTFTDQSLGQEAPTCVLPPHVWSVLPPNVLLSSGSLGNVNGQPQDHNAWTSGSTSIQLYFLSPGIYTLMDLVGNACGSDSTSTTIVVDCITGMSAPEEKGLWLGPNPATDECLLQRSNADPGVLTLRDMTGRVVRQQRIGSEKRIAIALMDVPSGTYALEVRTGTQYTVLRLVKQ